MPKKGVVPPHLRPFLFKKGHRRGQRRHAKRRAVRGIQRRTSMARRRGRRRGRGSRRQGIASWGTSAIALGIGLSPVIKEVAYAAQGSGTWGQAFDNLNAYYNPFSGRRDLNAVAYGSLLGGLVFKVVTSELLKRAKMKSLVPSI